jgi:hypothetical protein
MKIKFTAFNRGQEHFVFDTDSLKPGEELDNFIIARYENGNIFVVPMIVKDKNTRYPYPVLERVYDQLHPMPTSCNYL